MSIEKFSPTIYSLLNKIGHLSKDKKIVFTNGCFDILHAGHLFCLIEAKRHGDVLIIGLNGDRSIEAIKGKNRPIFKEIERIRLLSSIDCVDHIIVFDEETPINLISAIKPDILVKGGDWEKSEIVGADIVTKRGGEVIIINHNINISTTKIINRVAERIYNDKVNN